MRIVLALLMALSLASCEQGTSNVHERMEVWSQRVAKLPAGSSSPQIQLWAKSYKVNFMFLPQQRQFSANVESVPVKGIGFPCSAWNIIVIVSVDQSGHSTKNIVQSVGTCV